MMERRRVLWPLYFLSCRNIDKISKEDAVLLFNRAGVRCRFSALEWKPGRPYQFIKIPPEMAERMVLIIQGLKIQDAPIRISLAINQPKWSDEVRQSHDRKRRISSSYRGTQNCSV